MNWQHVLVLGILVSLIAAGRVQAQSPEYFSGFYVGLEGGTISYNTQITFDGVDDPAGRSGAGYGALLGYNHTYAKVLVGAELVFNLASDPDPYTFDPAVVGFSEMDVRRAASIGLDLRAGYLVIQRILLYAAIGYSANTQSVRMDGVPLEQFAGGAAEEAFGAFQYGGGLEVALHRKLGFRFSFRTLRGHDLSATDFGTIPTTASLTRFDVEPSQQQFFVGLLFRF